MALSTEDRRRVWRGLMRRWSKLREAMSLDKDDLWDAVVATDDWIEDNQASFNAALPAVAQAGLTVLQKTIIFCAVALARVSIELLRHVFGEVG